MNKNRAARESRNEAKHRERRNRIRALLVQLGLWDELTKLGLRDVLLKSYNSKLEISVSEEFPTDEHIEATLRELAKASQKATFNCPLLGDNYSIADYFMYVQPLAQTLGRIQLKNLASPLQLKLQRIAQLDAAATTTYAIKSMYDQNLHRIIATQGRIDEYIYFIKWTANQTPNNRLQHRIVIDRVQSERLIVIKDTKPRPAYRCGIPMFGCVEWAGWPSRELDLTDEDKTYPVFVQSHVFEMLFKRVGGIFYGEGLKSDLHYCLVFALCYANIHLRRDGAFLVEYYLGKYKLGYLLARKQDDLILVETFLFLTMDGTPEGDELGKQLRLKRTDKEYQGLDDLRTFVLTDLAVDSELVEIFTKCGCGHLFELGKALRDAQIPVEFASRVLAPGYAAGIRKYLRMKSP